MNLRKITLSNIRSYKSETLVFPEGSTLLSGDIGSGKTTILLAIEFGLFGLQPGQKGASLLRNGEKNGAVSLEFEADGKKVIIERSMKRGKGVTQDYCSISVDGEKKEISVSETKDKVLEILNYPKEFAKKQNLLYKFTVYTPQEEMKQIILQDSETRINTLRHVFGIDKYKKILENLSVLLSKIREEKRIKQALVSSIDEDKGELEKKERELELKKSALTSTEKEFLLKKQSRKKAEEEKKEISEKVEEKRKLESEIDKAKITTAHKKDSIASSKKNLENLETQIKELGLLEFDEGKKQVLQDEIKNLQNQKDSLSEKNLQISSKIASLEMKNSDLDLTKQKLKKIEICPTCLQDVHDSYKVNVFNKCDSDIFSNVKQIEEFVLEKNSVEKKLGEVRFEISSKEKELQDLNLLKVKLESVDEKRKNIELILKNIEYLEKDVEILNKHIESLKNSVFAFSKFDSIFLQKQKNLDEALKGEREAEIKFAELKKEIEFFSKSIEEMVLRINKIELIKTELNRLTNLEDWLSKKFSPVISLIEKNVMVKLKSEFSKLFSEWFSMLVSGEFHAKILDDFSPVIEEHDYEIDYAYLSGGERTAVALAYRLALNQVINSVLSKIKTKNFIILDEPTDGFSETQLIKMREVLEQLNIGQLIIVSHEQKIEGFVENVIKISKENGVSKVGG